MNGKSIMIRQHNSLWDDYVSYSLTGGAIEFTEQMVCDMTREEVDGRTIRIDSFPDFARLIGVADDRTLDDVIEYKASRGLLNIDYMHRFAELHGLKYEIRGDRMFAAYRKYREKVRMEKQEREQFYEEMYREGRTLLYGLYGGYGKNEEKGLQLLNEAMENGCISAFRNLIGYYVNREEWGKTAYYASEGADLGDIVSMTYMSRLYEKGVDFENFTDELGAPDYENAVTWCLKSAESGNIRDISRLNRFIHKGYLAPDSKRYVRLIKAAAQNRKDIYDSIVNYPFVDPKINAAHQARKDDIDRAIELLKEAIADSKPEAYYHLAECYLDKEMYGMAAQTAIHGYDEGDKRNLFIIARLYILGADLIGFSDRIGAPDYKKAAECYVRIVEEIPFPVMAIHILNGYIKEGRLSIEELPEKVREKIEHYNRHRGNKTRRKPNILHG